MDKERKQTMHRKTLPTALLGLVVSIVITLLALRTAAPAFAVDPCTGSGSPATCNTSETASITATVGSLTLNVNNGTPTFSFPDTSVGTASTLTSFPIEVDDDRGGNGINSNGWLVNINVPGTLTSSTHSFTPTWLYEQAPACATTNSCTVPASGGCPTISTPATLSSGGFTVCDSGTTDGAGEGSVALASKLAVGIPFDTIPDIYGGTIIVTVTSIT